MHQILLLLICVGASPLNAPIQEDVITLPPNISFNGEEYDYKVLWVHDAPFVLVGQYYKKLLEGGFVMYAPYTMKPRQDVYVQYDTRFVRVGTAIYRKRLVHVLVPINKMDIDKVQEIKQEIQPLIKEYYGSF